MAKPATLAAAPMVRCKGFISDLLAGYSSVMCRSHGHTCYTYSITHCTLHGTLQNARDQTFWLTTAV